MGAASPLKGILGHDSLSCSLPVWSEPRRRPGGRQSQVGSIYHHLECFLWPKNSQNMDKELNSVRLLRDTFRFWCLFCLKWTWTCFSDSAQASSLDSHKGSEEAHESQWKPVVKVVVHHFLLIESHSIINIPGDSDLKWIWNIVIWFENLQPEGKRDAVLLPGSALLQHLQGKTSPWT